MANPTYQTINRIAEESLRASGHTTPEKAMRSRELVDTIQNEIKARNHDA